MLNAENNSRTNMYVDHQTNNLHIGRQNYVKKKKAIQTANFVVAGLHIHGENQQSSKHAISIYVYY